MKIVICKNTEELGVKSAEHATKLINEAIDEKGYARILLSTGSSQFPFFKEFVKINIDWSKVEMFHLDEYVGIADTHPASFRRYLLDRFINIVNPGKYYLIDGNSDPILTIKKLTAQIAESPVDVGLIGIGENAHIAFNDPPAVFEEEASYKVVTLEKRCLQQQVNEGWFNNEEECFKQAITMTCPQIMKCKHIISVVPHAIKAEAVYNTLTSEKNVNVPATLLKEHDDCTIYLDDKSSQMLTNDIIKKYK